MLRRMDDGVDGGSTGRVSRVGFVALGFPVLVGLHLTCLVAFSTAASVLRGLNPFAMMFSIGVSQLVYVIPTVVLLGMRRTARARAMACDGLVFVYA